MNDSSTQTEDGLLDPLFFQWISYIKSNLPPPPPTRLIAPPPQENSPTFDEWFEALNGNSFEVYALKANYEETFHCQLSIYQFSALKAIRLNFNKITRGTGKNKQIIYEKNILLNHQ